MINQSNVLNRHMIKDYHIDITHNLYSINLIITFSSFSKPFLNRWKRVVQPVLIFRQTPLHAWIRSFLWAELSASSQLKNHPRWYSLQNIISSNFYNAFYKKSYFLQEAFLMNACYSFPCHVTTTDSFTSMIEPPFPRREAIITWAH